MRAGWGDYSCSELAKVPPPGSLCSPPSPPAGGREKDPASPSRVCIPSCLREGGLFRDHALASRRPQRLAHPLCPRICGRRQEADVGLRGDELRAATDCLDLAFDVPIAAAAGEYPMLLRGRDYPVLGGDDVWIV